MPDKTLGASRRKLRKENSNPQRGGGSSEYPVEHSLILFYTVSYRRKGKNGFSLSACEVTNILKKKSKSAQKKTGV